MKLKLVILIIMVCAACAAGWKIISMQMVASAPVSELMAARQIVAEKIPMGYLVWSRNDTIMMTETRAWAPVELFEGDTPRFAPDGKTIVYTKGSDAYLYKLSSKSHQKILTNVITEYGTGAYWSESGKEIIAISGSDPHLVLRYIVESKETNVLHDENAAPFKGFQLSQGADLRFDNRFLLSFTTDGDHQGFIIDLKEKRYIQNNYMAAGDCEPAWSPDGTFIINTRRSRQRPLYMSRFDIEKNSLSEAIYLIGKGRCHNTSISNDNNFVTYIASGHIYFWDLRDTVHEEMHGLQLSSEGGNSNPNLYVTTLSN